MSSIELIDTHCHIHEAQLAVPDSLTDDLTHGRWTKAGSMPAQLLEGARRDGVVQLLCIGTDVDDSELAVNFVQEVADAYATVGMHPHEAKRYADDAQALSRFAALAERPKVAGVGECGLDFYYNHSGRAEQERILRYQIELALQHDLPMSFHVRDAFDDFWRIFDSYASEATPVRGVIHSFTAGRGELDRVLARGLHIGLNGIMTFTKDEDQLAAAKAVPLDKLLLETDAPYLTPAPYRGKICEPKHVRVTLEFLAALRDEEAAHLAAATTANARQLFNLPG